jgi:hypothetical protein
LVGPGLKWIDDGQTFDPAPGLQVLAEKDAATGVHGGSEQDAIPPGEAVAILDSPSELRDFEVIRSGAELLESGDLRPSFVSSQQTTAVCGDTIEFI